MLKKNEKDLFMNPPFKLEKYDENIFKLEEIQNKFVKDNDDDFSLDYFFKDSLFFKKFQATKIDKKTLQNTTNKFLFSSDKKDKMKLIDFQINLMNIFPKLDKEDNFPGNNQEVYGKCSKEIMSYFSGKLDIFIEKFIKTSFPLNESKEEGYKVIDICLNHLDEIFEKLSENVFFLNLHIQIFF